jgi:hypothetical protein
VKAWRLCAWVCSPESVWGPPVDHPAGSEGEIGMNPQDYSHRTAYRPQLPGTSVSIGSAWPSPRLVWPLETR